MQPELVILAAGMASRYGSMKQVQSFGPGGETIMDYSIYDAIRAGFGKVVFVIRKDFSEQFLAIFESKLKGRIQTEYVFQELDDYLPKSFPIPNERTKPWGTAHAVLCASPVVKLPFAVINADDYYGRDSFQKIAAFLRKECDQGHYSVLGYELGKTLSLNGSVSRGVCSVDQSGNLTGIRERTKIIQKNGEISFEEEGRLYPLVTKTLVSMNFWGLHPSFFDMALEQFHHFVNEYGMNPKSEYFIPLVIDYFSTRNLGTVKVIPTSSQWFGVTYKEDAPGVAANINQLVKEGVYPSKLWN